MSATLRTQAPRTPLVEVEFDDDLDDDVAHFQALIDSGKIAAPIITMPPGFLDKIVPRLPTLDSLGLSATLDNLSRMLTPEVLGLRESLLTDSVTAQLASQMPTFKMPELLANSISANLTERMSRAVDNLAASVMKQFDSTILKSIPSWLPNLASLQLHLPSNWRGVRVDVDEIEQDVFQILSEGIPLAWVPNRRVIILLLDAPDAQARRRVISNNRRGIVTTCANVRVVPSARWTPAVPRGHDCARRTRVSGRTCRGGPGSRDQRARHTPEWVQSGCAGTNDGSMLNPEYSRQLAEERSWRLQLALRPSFTPDEG